MKVSEIQTVEPFSTIFPIDKHVLTAVVMDMRRDGYDAAHPVIAWRGRNIVVDGHTRLEAARLVGIEDVPVVERDFRDEDEAVRYAIHCQRDRRNLTDADIVRLVEELDKRKAKGERTDLASSEATSTGKSAEDTAKLIGTSRSKVEKARAVIEQASPEVKKAVDKGKKAGGLSLNQAYKTTRNTSNDETVSSASTPAPAEAEGAVVQEGKTARPRIGLKFAHLAVDDLERIAADDIERESAFDHVAGWIEQQSAEPVDDQNEGDTDGPRLSTYTATIQGRNIRAVQAQLRKTFGDAVLKVEKVEHPTSRSARLAEAEGMVESAKGLVEELQQEMEGWRENMPENMQDGAKAEEVGAAADALQEIADALEVDFNSVEFPGMF